MEGDVNVFRGGIPRKFGRKFPDVPTIIAKESAREYRRNIVTKRVIVTVDGNSHTIFLAIFSSCADPEYAENIRYLC